MDHRSKHGRPENNFTKEKLNNQKLQNVIPRITNKIIPMLKGLNKTSGLPPNHGQDGTPVRHKVVSDVPIIMRVPAVRASAHLRGSPISDKALQPKATRNTSVVEQGRAYSMGNPSWASQQACVRKT